MEYVEGRPITEWCAAERLDVRARIALLAQVCDATLELLGLGLVPIVNDNDAVTSRTTSVFSSATNEVQWDNDILAARLAISLRADLLLVLTDMDALYITVPEASATDSAAQVERLPLYREGVTIARTGMHFDQLHGDVQLVSRVLAQVHCAENALAQLAHHLQLHLPHVVPLLRLLIHSE
jgi:hypothetical protein